MSLDALLKRAITKATSDFHKEKKTTRRNERLGKVSRSRLLVKRYRKLTIKQAAFKVMEQAYMRASANNTLPANARQIMYQARPLIQALGVDLWKNSDLFTQTYLPLYMRTYADRTAGWDVAYDARGHFQEPHTDDRVDLGTLAVREYIADWQTAVPDVRLDKIDIGIRTCGPANRYKFALFIEKEGFTALLDRAEIRNRFDIAIMSTKGMSVTASRQLVEQMSMRGVKTFVLHDFDISGFTICRTLRESTERFRFTHTPNAECLGLRLDDVLEMDLESESVDVRGYPKAELTKCGATDEEITFLEDGERVELNAMDSAQFIEWLERKLTEHGVQKVVPDKAMLEATYKLALLTSKANKAVTQIQTEWDANGHDVAVPADLEEQIRQRLELGSNLSWEQAIADLLPAESDT